MGATISGTFRTTHWNEVEYGSADQGSRLAVTEKESAIDGGIQGTGVLRYSVAYLSDGSSVFTGHQRITGRIDDREGSFVVEDRGSGNAEGASGTWAVVAGSGSGDLAGLTGEGSWTWENGSETTAYTFSSYV